MVLPGDSVQIIAEKFLSTEDGIIAENELSDSYLIFPGQILLVPYWLITPTFGPPDSTATPIVTPTP
jgi:LysM repeat protein